MLKKATILFSLITLLFLVYGYGHYTNKINSVVGQAEDSEENEKKDFSLENNDIFVDSFNGKLSIYQKSKKQNKRFVAYYIEHNKKGLNKEDVSSNYDVWNLAGANEVEVNGNGNFRSINKIVTTGEWELALKEKDASDFVGGILHGDEITTSVELLVDGQKLNLKEMIKQPAKEIKLTTVSDLYRDNTISENLTEIAQHKKIYTFNKNGLTIDQEIKFKYDLTLEKSYLTMFPILRKSNGEKGQQITDTIRINDKSKEYSIAEKEFNIPEINAVKANQAFIYGKDSGYAAEVKVVSKSPEYPTIFHVSDNELYNKLYFSFNEGDQKASEGDVWKQKTEYKISIDN